MNLMVLKSLKFLLSYENFYQTPELIFWLPAPKDNFIFLLYIGAERYVTGKQLQAYFRNNNTCSV